MNNHQCQSRGLESLPLQQKSRSVQKLQNYQEKAIKALELNAKLKQLLQTITNNNLARKIQTSNSNQIDLDDNQQLARMNKKQTRLHSQIQQLTNNLNLLTSENNKLKAQVNNSRNSRVIYSNVYKTIQKQIRKHQYLYRLSIIDYLAYEQVDAKVNQKIAGMVRKLQKDINQLQGKIKPIKKDKSKARINTGLSTFRASNVDSKGTNRNSTQGNTSNRLQTKTELFPAQTGSVSRRQGHQLRIYNQKQKSDASLIVDKQRQPDKNKLSRSRSKIPTEHLLDEQYEILMRNNYYNNVCKQLREISGVQKLQQIEKVWKQAQADLDSQYAIYLSLQDQLKAVQNELSEIKTQKDSISTKEQPTDKTAEQQQLERLQEEFRLQKDRMAGYESKLTELMDLNCAKLNDEQIHQHISRMKRRGESTSRDLERLLENVSKDRTQLKI